MKYRFLETKHLHQLKVNGEWKNLTGTSSVGNVLAKPLTWWASGKAVEELGWLHPKKHSEEERARTADETLQNIQKMGALDYLKLLDKAYRAHSTNLKQTAGEGIDLHQELEDFVKGRMGLKEVREYDKKIEPFIIWSDKNVKRFLWSEAHCFDEDLWVGGISDTGAELVDDSVAVIDFKRAKAAYPTHFLQDAGYTIQIEKNGLYDKNGEHNKELDKKIDKLIVIPFGAEEVIPEVRTNVDDYKKGFAQAVGLYRLLGLEKRR